MQKVIIDVPNLDNPQNVVNGSIASALITKAYKNGTFIPENATNGDIIKIMFPDVEVTEIKGSFDKDKLLGYRTWLGGRSQDYLLDWWNAPYKKESEK